MIFLIGLIILTLAIHPDPAPGMLRNKESARNLECEPVGAETAAARRPGQVVTSGPRGDYVERDAVHCVERLTRVGQRDPRDEAILSSLQALSAEMATAAIDRRPDLRGRTWLVESFYPSAAVSAKLSFAAKNALSSKGLRVSDRTPILATGDIEVLTRLDPESAYPAACQRYARSGAVDGGHALLAVVSRDPRETLLHAGLCADGQWTWLQ